MIQQMNTMQIYGICWNIYDDQGIPLIRYMKKFPHQMTSDEIYETLVDFNNLTDKQKKVRSFDFTHLVDLQVMTLILNHIERGLPRMRIK
jgi:hypothetical protein